MSFIAIYNSTVEFVTIQFIIRKVREFMGLIPVRESDVFFVPPLYHVDQFTFHKKKKLINIEYMFCYQN